MKPYRSVRSLSSSWTLVHKLMPLYPLPAIGIRYHSHSHGNDHHHSHGTSSSSSSSSTSSSNRPSSLPSSKTVSFEEIRKHVRNGDYEAYLCGSLMPSMARESFFILRSFNLELASIRDSARGNANTGKLRFAFWRDMIERAYKKSLLSVSSSPPVVPVSSGGISTGVEAHPLFLPLCRIMQQNNHTKRFFEYLIDIRETDLDESNQTVQSQNRTINVGGSSQGASVTSEQAITSPSISNSIATLENYGEKTHGSLLYLTLESLHIRNTEADEAAKHLGKALGIVTILRGFPVHARLGQRYLPNDLMLKYGLTDHDVTIHPEEVVTVEGRPFVQEMETTQTTTTKENNTNSIENRNRSMAMTLARSNAGFGSAIEIQSVGGSSGVASSATTKASSSLGSSPKVTDATSSSSSTVSVPKSSVDKQSSSSGIRLAPSPAAVRLANQKKNENTIVAVPNVAASKLGSSSSSISPSSSKSPSLSTASASVSDFLDFSNPSTALSLSSPPTKRTATRSASIDAAYAVLRSGTGASQLRVQKSSATVKKVSLAIEELVNIADQHILTARSLASKLPPQASAALLPATPASRFLEQLRKHNYNIFDNGGGLGPWQEKNNPWSKFSLQWELLWKTIQNRY